MKSLCQEVKITRQAFYYHFDDIYSLLEEIYRNKALSTIGENRTYDSWVDGYRNVFSVMLQYKDFVINTYKSISKEYLEIYLYDVTFDLLFSVIKEKAKEYSNVTIEQQKFIAHFYKYAFVGNVLDWLKKDMQKDPNEIIDNFSKIIHGDFVDALKTFNSENIR
ncbi:MAG: TetR/AcrR family transcriptional regulator [Bacilli bacterium]